MDTASRDQSRFGEESWKESLESKFGAELDHLWSKIRCLVKDDRAAAYALQAVVESGSLTRYAFEQEADHNTALRLLLAMIQLQAKRKGGGLDPSCSDFKQSLRPASPAQHIITASPQLSHSTQQTHSRHQHGDTQGLATSHPVPAVSQPPVPAPLHPHSQARGTPAPLSNSMSPFTQLGCLWAVPRVMGEDASDAVPLLAGYCR